MSNIPRHKVFISYYHADDQEYKDILVDANKRLNLFQNLSVIERGIDDAGLSAEQIRRIIRDEYMREATVLLLLCGRNSSRRKHIDWEIHTAMYHSDINPQMGIVVVNLPTISQCQRSACNDDKPYFGQVNWVSSSRDRASIDQDYPYLPSRIKDNFEKGGIYIPVINWDTFKNNVENLAGVIDVAFNYRYQNEYDHSTPLRRNNS